MEYMRKRNSISEIRKQCEHMFNNDEVGGASGWMGRGLSNSSRRRTDGAVHVTSRARTANLSVMFSIATQLMQTERLWPKKKKKTSDSLLSRLCLHERNITQPKKNRMPCGPSVVVIDYDRFYSAQMFKTRTPAGQTQKPLTTRVAS